MPERIEVTVNGTAYTVEVENLESLNGAPLEVRVNGRPYTVQLQQGGEKPARVTRPEPAPAQPAARPEPAKPAPAPAAPPTGAEQRVTAPMPGKILSVAVKVGDQVQAKDALCTLEAMKMEMTIAAPAAGIVRNVRAQVGANVVYGDLLFVID